MSQTDIKITARAGLKNSPASDVGEVEELSETEFRQNPDRAGMTTS